MSETTAAAPAAIAQASQKDAIQPDALEWLDPRRLVFHWDGGEAPVRLTVGEGRSVLRLLAARVFPHSDPNRFLQLFEAKPDGARGDPVGVLEDLDALATAGRAAVEECLRRSSLVARVLRIVALADRLYLVHWVVETDRGLCEFDMDNVGEQFESLEGGRVIMKDMAGNRYEIPDRARLDAESRAWLELYI